MYACVCVRVFKAFAKLDFCSSLTGGFVESLPDMIFRYCESLTPLICAGSRVTMDRI